MNAKGAAGWRRLWSVWRRPKVLQSERWVMVDVETSGLDARRDRLLAIAGIAVTIQSRGSPAQSKPSVLLGDSFEVVLRQAPQQGTIHDKENILIHGIGIGAQRSGCAPADALKSWLDFVGDSPLVAYHSDFDRVMIERACKEHLGRIFPAVWLDLEPLAAVIHQDPHRRPLDHWLARYGIVCLARHQASADTLATAQLLLRLWPMLPPHVQTAGFHAVRDHAAGHRFIPGRH